MTQKARRKDTIVLMTGVLWLANTLDQDLSGVSAEIAIEY